MKLLTFYKHPKKISKSCKIVNKQERITQPFGRHLENNRHKIEK